MKLQEIFENDQNNFNIFLEQLKVNCSEYYKQQLPLYRGINDKKGYQVIPIRKDRQLRNTFASQNIIFNHLFEKIHGIPFIRNQVAFVSRKKSVTSLYGYPYYVFPENSSYIIYNEDIVDSMEAIKIPQISFDDLINIDKEIHPEIKKTKGTIDDLFKQLNNLSNYGLFELTKKEIINVHKEAIENNENMIRNYKITKEIPQRQLSELMIYGDNLYIIEKEYIGDFENLYKNEKEQ